MMIFKVFPSIIVAGDNIYEILLLKDGIIVFDNLNVDESGLTTRGIFVLGEYCRIFSVEGTLYFP